ncbi:unnamed protein product [Phyllotreta striolata]|uniref:Uncharacterized protein n=1 Tax=Phyllotreta striolata TaxID=444603 RepID=A0A9N9TFF4_PHYSR|nr:unnamed protein product [Phyllotreta striolata]
MKLWHVFHGDKSVLIESDIVITSISSTITSSPSSPKRLKFLYHSSPIKRTQNPVNNPENID